LQYRQSVDGIKGALSDEGTGLLTDLIPFERLKNQESFAIAKMVVGYICKMSLLYLIAGNTLQLF